MKETKRRLAARASFAALLVITFAVLAPVAYAYFFLGIAIHDQVYLASPDLGPEEWTQFTGEIFGSVMLVIGPLFVLLTTWMIACGIFVALLTRKERKRAVEQ